MAQASDARLGPLIADWDIGDAWLWDDWPDRKTTDLGIDASARRRSDGRLIAIQCKSRKLDEHGRGKDIGYDDMAKFIAISEPELWAERWLVVIGDTRIRHNAKEVLKLLQKPATRINIEADLRLSLRLIVALHTGGRTRRALSRTLGDRDRLRRGQDPHAGTRCPAAQQDPGTRAAGTRRPDAGPLRRALPEPRGRGQHRTGSGPIILPARRQCRAPPDRSSRRFPPQSTDPTPEAAVLKEILEEQVVSSRGQARPRRVKRKMSNYPLRIRGPLSRKVRRWVPGPCPTPH